MYSYPSNRRDFLKSLTLTATTLLLPTAGTFANKPSQMRLGLVTYQWGKDWDMPTLIRNCEKAKVLGVELRTEHKHGVEPHLTKAQRQEVKKRFTDSQVALVGYGANEQFDSPDPAMLKKNIDRTKELLLLSRDVGGSGVKVKPTQFHPGVPHEKTIEQIGRPLNEVGKFASHLGQLVRMEVHGEKRRNYPISKRSWMLPISGM